MVRGTERIASSVSSTNADPTRLYCNLVKIGLGAGGHVDYLRFDRRRGIHTDYGSARVASRVPPEHQRRTTRAMPTSTLSHSLI